MIFLLIVLFFQTNKTPSVFILVAMTHFYVDKIVQLCLGKEPRIKITSDSILLMIGLVTGVLWEISAYINACYILMHLRAWILSKTSNTEFVFFGFLFVLVILNFIAMKTIAVIISIKNIRRQYKTLYYWFEGTTVNKILILKILNKISSNGNDYKKFKIYNSISQIELTGQWVSIPPYRVLISNNEFIIKNEKEEMSAYSSYAEFLKAFRKNSKS